MRIALVHDDLVQWGGAERVLLGLCKAFPDAPIYTSVFDEKNEILRENFSSKKIVTSFLQRIPGWRSLYRTLLPLYPIAFEQFDFSGFDIVISQTTRFAKSILTKPSTVHICYCHTPPRFLWNFSQEQQLCPIQPYLSFLRIYDVITSYRVDCWVAGSVNAQERIQKIYHVQSRVIYPFIELDSSLPGQVFNGGYLLVVSRLNMYKNIDLVINTANIHKIPLKIVGSGPCQSYLDSVAGPTIDFLGTVDEDKLRMIFAGCKALVVAGEEDFGLTALEAHACGKPVIAYGKGGVTESVKEGVTGYFFDTLTADSLISALIRLDENGYNEKECLVIAKHFSKERFIRQFKTLVGGVYVV